VRNLLARITKYRKEEKTSFSPHSGPLILGARGLPGKHGEYILTTEQLLPGI
jgi:hypothetical protein